MTKKKKCDFRMPDAELIDSAYTERWAIYCSCGTTIFGNSKEQCENTWRRHIGGAL